MATEQEAVAEADIGYPVVMKAIGAKIVHKTELRAVIVRLDDATAVREVARPGVATRRNDDGSIIKMVTRREVLVSAVEDPTLARLACTGRHRRGCSPTASSAASADRADAAAVVGAPGARAPSRLSRIAACRRAGAARSALTVVHADWLVPGDPGARHQPTAGTDSGRQGR